ncbi:hypothetical protein, no similarity [Maudiozyma saulgeensis]|uniref:t-SNARE coiled-coil homology domain-containing protein n=1 Tax=Maudiozyma saulgeensis TaxID=1789683 RepID=A0A1X7R6T1_9SACH|nr:hypothetical protein, no similarity [Kazachstania saulgeensis]
MRIRHSRHSEVGKRSSRKHHSSYLKIKEQVVQYGRHAKAKLHRISKPKENSHIFIRNNEHQGMVKKRASLRTKLYKGTGFRRKRKSEDSAKVADYGKSVSNSIKENQYYHIYNSFDDEINKFESPPGSADSSFQQQKQVYLVKNNSLQSLKNMIKMGYEAESSGTHALDRLQCQHDILRDVDNKLDRMQVYNKRASDNIMHLRGLKPLNNVAPRFDDVENRSINVLDIKGTPLKSKNYLENYNYASTTAVSSRATDLLNYSPEYTPRRYDVQFEFSSPDGDIDSYINKALDEVGNISRKLRYIAQETSEELDCQLNRLAYTEDSLQRVGSKINNNSNKLESMVGKSNSF